MCVGSAAGGTTLCGVDSSSSTVWTAVFNSATPDTIEFFAPTGTSLAMGQSYFVNVFLLPGTGVSGEAFTGAWTTPPRSPLVSRCSALLLPASASFAAGRQVLRPPRQIGQWDIDGTGQMAGDEFLGLTNIDNMMAPPNAR